MLTVEEQRDRTLVIVAAGEWSVTTAGVLALLRARLAERAAEREMPPSSAGPGPDTRSRRSLDLADLADRALDERHDDADVLEDY